MPRIKYPWHTIEQLYIAGDDNLTLRKLAEDYGCSYATVRKHSMSKDWIKRRETYRTEVAAETREKLVSLEARRRVDMLELAENMKRVGSESLRRIAAQFATDPTFNLGPQETRLLLKDCSEIERKALGIPDIVAYSEEEIDDALEDELERAIALREGAGSQTPTPEE